MRSSGAADSAAAEEATGAEPRRRSSPKGEATREKILDAAEYLFAERGFHGVSLRDITRLAGVELALASYHFGTKENLLCAVVSRRAEEHRDDMLASLDQAIAAAAPGLPSNEALVEAYARPALEKIARSQGWAAYIKLIVGIQNLARDDRIGERTDAEYDPAIRRYVEAFVASNPDVDPHRVHFAVYFLHGALIQILSQGWAFERLLENDESLRDTEELIETLAGFFARGVGGRAQQRG
ncbi:MAG: TetR family transcriptional regulator [Alphaproteobacteria bacterium]|nr:TetR family transcriptional regulator [Alphaproteobacteria bacterium]